MKAVALLGVLLAGAASAQAHRGWLTYAGLAVAGPGVVAVTLGGADAASPVVVDLAEVRAMRLLDDAGLAPPQRHIRSTG